MNILDNIWVKRVSSVFCGLYTLFVAWLVYASFVYKISYTNKPVFAFVYVAVTLFFLLVMLFSRKQLITMILSMVMMAMLLPIVLLNFGDWLLLIPMIILIVTMFFACGATEKLKTILGTVFLLFYIIGGLGFFLFTNLFIAKVDKTIIEEQISPSSSYRYIIYDVIDNGGGKTEVYVEPANRDIKMGIVEFKVKGTHKCVFRVRNHEKPDVQWIDNDMLYINGDHYSFEIDSWNLFEIF